MGFKFENRSIVGESGSSGGSVAGVTSVNGKTGMVFISSMDIRYDSSTSNITSTNIQNAIKELDSIVNSNKISIQDIVNAGAGCDCDSTTDCEGKVKVNALDDLDFLDTKVDNKTIQIVKDKLVAKSLDGLDSSIDELNMLVGAKSNIQSQINALAQVGSFIGAVDTKSDLDVMLGAKVNDVVVVVSDESNGGGSTIYMYDGASWVYVGEFKVEVRDFSTNPINLTTEVTGLLNKSNVDNTIVKDTDLDVPLLNKVSIVNGKLGYDGKQIAIENEVNSVNGKQGQVILNSNDVGAVANILGTCSGIQIGTMSGRPAITTDNLLYVTIDTTPNKFYRFDSVLNVWQIVGGAGGSGTGSNVAIDIIFNNSGTGLVSKNVQALALELQNLIKTNSTNIQTNKDKITDLKSKEGKVKSTSGDTLGYLDNKVDTTTIIVQGNKLKVKSLEGLQSSIVELNYLIGAKSNIQAQIDSLNSLGTFRQNVPNHAGLSGVVDPKVNDLVIVLDDETQGGGSSSYLYNGTDFIFVGKFETKVRDFTTDPIDLSTEVIGKLPPVNVDDTAIQGQIAGVQNDLNNKYDKSDKIKESDLSQSVKDKINSAASAPSGGGLWYDEANSDF